MAKEIKKKEYLIGWKVKTLTFKRASTRYRALLPALYLKESSYKSYVFSDFKQVNLNKIDILVFVKTFTKRDFFYAQRAKDKKIKIFIDLCDNIFIPNYDMKEHAAYYFKLMSHFADHIVVPTVKLKKIIQECIVDAPPISVIPDGIETKRTLRQSRRFLLLQKKAQILRNLKIQKHYFSDPLQMLNNMMHDAFCAIKNKISVFFLNRGNQKKRILWFGIHGGRHANFGMLDLLLIKKDLEKINQTIKIELCVISNHFNKYRKHILPFDFKTRYFEWTPHTVLWLLKKTDLVILPSQNNIFSECKSSNRALLALNNQVPVVATYKEVYKALEHCMLFDDFYHGIQQYLTKPEIKIQHLELANEIIKKEHSAQATKILWQNIIHELPKHHIINESIILLIAIPQDLDLALPLYLSMRNVSINPRVICTTSSLLKSPRIFYLLKENRIHFDVINDHAQLNSSLFHVKNKLLLTFSESNANPHRFQREMTKRAIKHNIKTVTMQHGFENIGLTYSDSKQPIENISILSRHIITWCDKKTLHPRISIENKNKCIALGCPKVTVKMIDKSLQGSIPSSTKRIGIFENLHWSRYDSSFKKAFLDAIDLVSRKCDDIQFILKPHHQGQWLTHRYSEQRSFHKNVIIIDPSNKKWSKHTAPDFFPLLDAVISTPSTVIFDAARHKLPVAVFSFNLTLNQYAPLTSLLNQSDWLLFVKQIFQPNYNQKYKLLSETFIHKNTVRGNASQNVIDFLLREINDNR